MKFEVIETRGLGELRGYGELTNGTHFIYKDNSFEFFAIKINDKFSALLNADGEFCLAEKYKNCLSIGVLSPKIFKSIDELKKYIKERDINGKHLIS